MKTYIIRNKITGLFLNETNFAEENANKAKLISGEISEVGIKAIWGENAQLIEITAEQITKLDLSDALDARADAHRTKARGINHPSVRAQLEGAATRLSQRATRVACEVYATFSKSGRTA